ncbi:MAG: methylenetetrahydrofolate--tRNA-(uracil(54)-C(5))-methyltransferase (FADH(2)-oxidizing) TrmFO [Hyphomicrobiales bacterium]|nr:methylenetetrahydrofolate--tRNA-(uracil(54)-C(5))-methyltransferase (FADH(2)-oxidizing) TrmFO [Hyphomicrobiales bacterium]
MKHNILHIIGGGLAGSEAAWQAANAGCDVVLHEMRGIRGTDAHRTDDLAELVCSNSFRSDDHQMNAVGVLHQEMRLANSLIIASGDKHKVPAGSALAVDRENFSNEVTKALENHPRITILREEIETLPQDTWQQVVIATGPLTSPALAEAIATATSEDALAFFDAIAPIVHFDSIDLDTAWFQSRYDKASPFAEELGGDGRDYINCPMNREQYYAFIDALVGGDKTEFKQWEGTPYFDGCLPIEIMAERGPETLRHGPMKPMGLTNAHKPEEKAYAVVQLRQDNALGSLYNMVGFQTKLKYGEQTRIFRTIPGLENAEFARLGGLHRNTFINSPALLDPTLTLKTRPGLRFAGQITGCEGYVESAAIGLLAARFAVAEMRGHDLPPIPKTTAFGALLYHITEGHIQWDDEPGKRSFQPMNINFGLFPPVEIVKPEGIGRFRGKDKARVKKQTMAARALRDCASWLNECEMLGEPAE